GEDYAEWLNPIDGKVFGIGRWSSVDRRTTMAIVDGDGTELESIDGWVMRPWVDDGIVPDVYIHVLAWGTQLRAGPTGPVLLEIDGELQDTPMLLHGAALVRSRSELRAIDLETGTERWSVEVEGGALLGTDGEVLVFHQGEELRAVSS